jgi:hypothetical protein
MTGPSVARVRAVSTLAAVTRVSVLGAGEAETVAVDVAQEGLAKLPTMADKVRLTVATYRRAERLALGRAPAYNRASIVRSA